MGRVKNVDSQYQGLSLFSDNAIDRYLLPEIEDTGVYTFLEVVPPPFKFIFFSSEVRYVLGVYC